jgi:hypothetical protein
MSVSRRNGLYPKLGAFKGSRSHSLKSHPIFSQLEGSNLVATKGSHDNPAEKITGGDIDVALADIDTLCNLFSCTNCGRYVQAKHQVSGKNMITCKCGKKEIDWKE